MNTLFVILFLFSCIVLLIGLFKPALVIRWGENKNRKMVLLIYGSIAILFFILVGITLPPEEDESEDYIVSEEPMKLPSTKPVARKISVPKIRLEKYNAGFFSIDKPRGWNIITAGACSEFAFLIRDQQEPRRQIFNFGSVGPIYLSHQQKQIDQQYMQMGGYPTPYYEMPVINPLTPENFLKQFHLITRTQIAQNFMPQVPRLENIQIVSSTPQQSFISGGQTKLMRALFVQNGRVAEGLFLLTVAQVLPFTGNPGWGTGVGYLFLGITAPQEEFRYIQKDLIRSLESFTLSQSYVENCIRQQNQTWTGIMKAGQTLSEASDIIMSGWENRNKTHDILSEKWSDTILGKERLYDPETGAVYEFENGFYDKYNINRQQYNLKNLQRLPDNNYNLWMEAPLEGTRHLELE
jgi:hypothetical protein